MKRYVVRHQEVDAAGKPFGSWIVWDLALNNAASTGHYTRSDAKRAADQLNTGVTR